MHNSSHQPCNHSVVKDASTSLPDWNNIKSYDMYPHGFLIKEDRSILFKSERYNHKGRENMQFNSGFPLNDMNSTLRIYWWTSKWFKKPWTLDLFSATPSLGIMTETKRLIKKTEAQMHTLWAIGVGKLIRFGSFGGENGETRGRERWKEENWKLLKM